MPRSTSSSQFKPPEQHVGADVDLVAMVELMFFAYRDFTGEPDEILQSYGFGRPHHRVLHFVNRNPGLRVTALQDVLAVTKQSLNRVLGPMVTSGWIEARPGVDDKRERNLFLAPKGKDLADRLLGLQIDRVKRALETADALATDSAMRGGVAASAILFLTAMQGRRRPTQR